MALIPLAVIVMKTVAETSVCVFFFRDLNWSSRKIGNYQAISMRSHMVSLIAVLPVLVALNFPDPLLSLIAVIANIAMNIVIGVSQTTCIGNYMHDIISTCFHSAAVVQGLDAFMVTPLRGYMSKIIHVEDQGIVIKFQ